eukprot:4913344-Amphidinium_carterae.1
MHMRFNREHPPMFGDGTSDPEARAAGEQEKDRPGDPDAGVDAEMVDYRTPSVPSPSEAETL